MLAMSRRVGEKIDVEDAHGRKIMTITVVSAGRSKVRLGIEAPKNIIVLRRELAKAAKHS